MIGFFTDNGNVRELNEDYFAYCIEDKFSLYIVADGMGGHNAGEVASKMAAEGIMKYIKEKIGKISIDNILEEAISNVNLDIYELATSQKGYGGMGTTLTAAFVYNNKIQIANVGDSCCFGLSNKGIDKLTRDNSLVQELFDCGCITEEEAKNHPRKNIITRALGTNNRVNADIIGMDKNEYDLFLLCTDGFANDLEKDEMWREIINSNDLNKSCEKLVEVVKQRGGRDNITVLVFGGESQNDR